MNVNEFDEIFELEQFESLSINELDYFIGRLQDIRNDKFHKQYKVVTVVNSNGNISNTIKNESGFQTKHYPVVQTLTSYCGHNDIYIPIDKYTKELEQQLIKNYDR